ncbi:MAG TPA: M1 family metallopeptidase, partial [Chthoniobacteraceae bacterium]|nr:M1 family metallopeptidase [Chthoniobacteraceae bacterium]
GRESIDLEARKPVRQFVLNSRGLEIANARIDGHPLIPQFDEAKQTLTFALADELPAGAHRLELDFSGKLGEQTFGLFIARYQDGAQQKRALATQMEATDARRMFPCWDEPAFRATFELTAVVPAAHTAVSNVPAAAETALADGLKEVRFEKTPPMASYLVAFFAGELDAIEDEVDGVKLRVLTTPGKRDEARYALEATKKILPFYNEYFGTKYPLPKLDQLALPSTGAGGMENWGAILYNDSAFLYDPNASSQSTKERVFAVVAHEIAHQWFGNLVTMAWWDNLWLNEGFASWMGTKATDRFNPEWQTWLRASGDKEWAMSLDARGTTHAIQQRVATDDAATDAFDEITYSKGQAFIRMLESCLGEQPFRDGIRAYVQRHAFSNTTTADLWKALENVSGKPVRALAAGWTEQPGFPVVKLSESAGDGATRVEIAQERFTLNQKKAEPLFWAIPIALGPAAAPLDARVILLKETTRMPIEPGLALKANIGGVGYFRAWYDDALFKRLRKAVPLMAAADRLDLFNDSWAMAEAGRAPGARCLDLIDLLRDDTTYAIADRIIGTLWFIHDLERGEPGEVAFHAWARALVQAPMARLGWDAKPGEKELDASWRSSVIELLGTFGDAAVRAEAQRRFRAFVEKGEPIPGNLRRTIFGLVGRDADAETWEKLHELSRAESSSEQKRILHRALASAQSPELASRTLALSLTDELLPEDATHLVRAVGVAGEQPALAVEFALAHLDALLAKLSALEANSYVPSLFRPFTDASRADELEAIARTKLSPAAAHQVAKTADEIRFKAALKKRLMPDIDDWCRSQNSKSQKPGSKQSERKE